MHMLKMNPSGLTAYTRMSVALYEFLLLALCVTLLSRMRASV